MKSNKLENDMIIKSYRVEEKVPKGAIYLTSSELAINEANTLTTEIFHFFVVPVNSVRNDNDKRKSQIEGLNLEAM